MEFVRWDRAGGCRFSVPACGGEVTEGFDGTARVALRHPDGTRDVLLEVGGPRDYGFWDAQWSPDGEWVLVSDSAERLLVVPAAGGAARLLATDASEPRWRQ